VYISHSFWSDILWNTGTYKYICHVLSEVMDYGTLIRLKYIIQIISNMIYYGRLVRVKCIFLIWHIMED